jgi:hypothetical protein
MWQSGVGSRRSEVEFVVALSQWRGRGPDIFCVARQGTAASPVTSQANFLNEPRLHATTTPLNHTLQLLTIRMSGARHW